MRMRIVPAGTATELRDKHGAPLRAKPHARKLLRGEGWSRTGKLCNLS
jgi:hypothetical protein